MCVKTCNRAKATLDSNTDYKNTCISTQNSIQNVYSYCDDRMRLFDKQAKNTCKLDMCNLCCSTMDPIKKLNYSFDNTKQCFQDCSKSNNFLN